MKKAVENPKEKATSERQLGIEQMEAELRNLEESHRLRGEQIAALESEQRGNIVAARVRKSADAQNNIERLAGEITKLRTEDTFDCVAMAEISADLEAERVMLRREQWRERCAAVRQLIEPRAPGDLEQQAVDWAVKLKEQLLEIAKSARAIASALRGIHPSLLSHADQVDNMPQARADAILTRLEPAGLPSPYGWQYRELVCKTIAGPVQPPFREVLQALDALARSEPAAQRA